MGDAGVADQHFQPAEGVLSRRHGLPGGDGIGGVRLQGQKPPARVQSLRLPQNGFGGFAMAVPGESNLVPGRRKCQHGGGTDAAAAADDQGVVGTGRCGKIHWGTPS